MTKLTLEQEESLLTIFTSWVNNNEDSVRVCPLYCDTKIPLNLLNSDNLVELLKDERAMIELEDGIIICEIINDNLEFRW